MMQLEVANQMTIQQLFDYSMEKLVQQGQRCLNRDGRCAYGNSFNRHCGIGWMLDETNSDLMSFTGSVGSLVHTYPDDVPHAIIQNVEVARLFQKFHDRHKQVEHLREAFDELADSGIDVSGPHWKQWMEL